MSVVPVTAAQVLDTQAPAVAEADADPKAPEAGKVQDPGISRQFAALSKKEKALFRAQEALKSEKAAITAAQARIAELEQKYGARPKSPREALERYGFTYQQAAEYELNDGNPTAEHLAREAQSEIKQLRQEQADRDRQAAERATQEAEAEKQRVVTEFREEIKGFVGEKAEEYELIKFNEAYDVVYSTVEQHYERTGRLLTIPEAANMVEKYLEKRLDEVQGLKKFAKTRQAEPQKPDPSGIRQPEPAQTRTLNNSVTSSSPTLVRNPRVEDDRMARALAALNK